MTDFKNEISYSFTREQSLLECPRQYYWRRYGYWNGWQSSATREQTLAWKLKRLSGPPLLMGDVLHKAIASDLENLKRGANVDKRFTLKQISDQIKSGYRQSNERAFLYSKEGVTFLGDYYDSCRRFIKPQHEVEDEALRQYSNWYKSKLREVLRTNPENIVSVEVMENYLVHGVPVYVVLDLVAKTKAAECVIFDWKTGKRDDSYSEQLALYAYYMHKVKGYPLKEIRMVNVYLKEGSDVNYGHPQFSANLLNSTIRRVEEGIKRLAEYLEPQGTLEATVKANIPKPMENFVPVLNNKGPCRFCNYRELCGLEEGTCA